MNNYLTTRDPKPKHHRQALGNVAFASDDATQATEEVTEERSVVSEITEGYSSLSNQQRLQQDAASTMKQKKRQQAFGLSRRYFILSVILFLLFVILTTVLLIVFLCKKKSSPNNPNLNIQGWQQVGDSIQDLSVAGFLGASLALSANGKIVVAGAPHANSEQQRAVGKVVAMEWNDQSQEWYSMMSSRSTTAIGYNSDEPAALLTGSSLNDFFGSAVALSGNGWTLAVGASRGEDGDEGYVRVFDWNHSKRTWQQVGQDLIGLTAKEGLGESVALSALGDVVAVGAPGGDDRRGFVRVFGKNKTGIWTAMGQDLMGISAGDEYGKAVAMSEDGRRLVVGGSQQQTTRTGLVQVFEYDEAANNWNQRGTTLNGHDKDHWFGETLDLSADGNMLAVGERGGSNGAGQVRVFVWNTTASDWDPMGQVLQGERPKDNFGSSLSLSSNGQTLVVGGSGNDGDFSGAMGTENAGHVRVFAWDRKKFNWQQVGQDINGAVSRESLGSTVAMSADGTVIAAGGPTSDGFSGHVRVFQAVF